MLFYLSNGKMVELNNSDIHLSEFLSDNEKIITTPLNMVKSSLKKSQFKKIKTVLQENLPISLDSLKEEKKQKALKEKLTILCEELTNDEQKQIISHIIQDFNKMFYNAVYRLSFVADNILLLVIEFLSIQCTKKEEDMFENLPYSIQGCSSNVNIKSLVSPVFHQYIDFIDARSDEELLQLSKSACLLGIKPLTTLLGCKLALIIINSPETELRKKFKIPEKFRNSVMDTIRENTEKIRANEWTKLA